jgi:hypothetical protein
MGGAQIAIDGENFNSNPGENRIHFNRHPTKFTGPPLSLEDEFSSNEGTLAYTIPPASDLVHKRFQDLKSENLGF